jgi:hypothetical protein
MHEPLWIFREEHQQPIEEDSEEESEEEVEPQQLHYRPQIYVNIGGRVIEDWG